MSIIVALSGGKASAWCAEWAFRNYPKESIVLYFNDTGWEHPDLHRFMSDLENRFDHPILNDSDGRTPEQLFCDQKALANNRMPFCSRVLKAERLQRYYKDGDTLVFGIGFDEPHRAKRLTEVYARISMEQNKKVRLRFPLIRNRVVSGGIDRTLSSLGIRPPVLYSLGFAHNNCSGGCVRAGKKHWKLLLERLPEVYADRERVEREFRALSGKDVHFFKDETLENFRKRVERGEISRFYDADETECIGICETLS